MYFGGDMIMIHVPRAGRQITVASAGSLLIKSPGRARRRPPVGAKLGSAEPSGAPGFRLVNSRRATAR
jgi:hypothetical protein